MRKSRFTEGDLDVQTFWDATDALQESFALETKYPDRDIVLVRADTSDEVRLAFRNHFSDARDFIMLVEQSCAKLSRSTVLVGGQEPNARDDVIPNERYQRAGVKAC